ncbi:tail fiber assembly protein [Erwinia psidii]|uniref:Tail fiber assembly protein n=1 Tax=Erwinia psidii TaxID=69224 RepID=A0A3N6V447_9GAMM|nr:tail fiber assembly protein [Erwinia psidii]MCX8956549.1 hypothetical protein [Erwinia psidii]MCX8961541.1 hypothetical protein [Erwinia psidii]MCX8964991.1 hypothetical protein [Erwinia psidii]RQM39885.1 hypothetical protein EB241_00795 [Erwinia psidii]
MNVWEILRTEAPENLLSDGYSAVIIDGIYSVDYKRIAELKCDGLMSDARNKISEWRTELELDVISDEDKTRLTAWMKYIKELKALDFTDMVDEKCYSLIEWPIIPSDL